MIKERVAEKQKTIQRPVQFHECLQNGSLIVETAGDYTAKDEPDLLDAVEDIRKTVFVPNLLLHIAGHASQMLMLA